MTTTIPERPTPPINKWNAEFYREFYRRQATLMKEWMSDEAVLQIAVMDVNSEEFRGVPLRQQQSFAQALEKAVKAKEIAITALARKGGSAPKGDALQELILKIARKNLDINQTQLLHMLRGAAGAGVVTSIDKPSDLLAGDTPSIHFVEDDGRPKTAPVRGLKDRLSRAKRKIKKSR